ncbi:MAG: DUF6624 domain-containing protein [bacterium]
MHRIKAISLFLLVLLFASGCSRKPVLSPTARFQMSIEAQMAFQNGQYSVAANRYSTLYTLTGKRLHYAVEAAAAWAMAGESGRAIQFLHRAIQGGYHDLNELESRDAFSTLKTTLEWNGIVNGVRENEKLYRQRINLTLYDLFQADQDDRRNLDWDALTDDQIKTWVMRDRQRMMATDSVLLADSSRLTSDDFFHAAIIFQHGPDSTWYHRANVLCQRALELNPDNEDANWLYAASMDRYLHSVGKPQIYGTQRNFKNGIWTVEPFDTSAVTDDNRIEHGIPPLGFLRAQVENSNRKSGNQ